MSTNETSATRKPVIDATIEQGVLTLKFDNGRTITTSPADLSQPIREHALMHGLKQKLVDAAAISRNTDTGRAASTDDKYAAVLEVYNRLLAGEWNKTREGGGNAGGLLFRALCRVYTGQTPDAIRAFLDKKTDGEKAALRKVAKVASAIEEIRAESAKADGIDGNALLDELDD